MHFIFLDKTPSKKDVRSSCLYSTSGDLEAIIAIFHESPLSVTPIGSNPSLLG